MVDGRAKRRAVLVGLLLFVGAAGGPACGESTAGRNRTNGSGGRAGGEEAATPGDASTAAHVLRLEVPIACPAGPGCVVRNFVDHDPAPGARDFRGGRLTYDEHRGTDVCVADGSKLVEGIEVLAAAAGTVVRLRDGTRDVSTRVRGRESVEGREAGNSIVIDHGDGWETQYCHLRRGSLRVARGDRVVAGQPLALVGLSGDTEFLHLHFEVRHDGVAIDPYTGTPPGGGNAAGAEARWTEAAATVLAYRDAVPFDAGFAVEQPDAWRARAGAYAGTRIATGSPFLVFWVDVVGPRAGDRETMTILGPDGGPIGEHSAALTESRVQRFQYFGKRRPPAGWRPGRYVGRYEVTRVERGTARLVLEVRRETTVP